VVLVLAGMAKALTYPFLYSAAFGAMTPLLNTPSLLYLVSFLYQRFMTGKDKEEKQEA